jgi:transcription antitermination factor NusG
MDKKWLVFYTKSRHEEKVRNLLQRRGYEVFMPMQKVVRQWSDRKKTLMVPLFNSYIFVNDLEAGIAEIVTTPGIAWNVRLNGKPAVLHPHEFDAIQRFLATGLFVEAMQEVDLHAGDRVVVTEGALKGMEGHLIQTPDGEKFTVSLATLGNHLLVTVDARALKRVASP